MRIIRPHLTRPDVQASKWRALPTVKEAIAERDEQAMEDAGITNAQILLGLAAIANVSPKDFLREDGTLKPVHELDDTIAATIQSIEIETAPGGVVRTKLKVPSKIEARKLLGQYKQLFTQNINVSGRLSLEQLVGASQQPPAQDGE